MSMLNRFRDNEEADLNYSMKPIISAVFCLLMLTSCKPQATNLSLVSPEKAYTLQFNEEVNSNSPFSYSYSLFFSLVKNGRLIIDKELISTRNKFEMRFSEEYPRYDWVSNNVLRLGRNDPLPQAQCNELLVLNGTSKTATYIEISGRFQEMFVIIELTPGASALLYAQPQDGVRADETWFGSKCLFEDGRKAYGTGTFEVVGVHTGPAHYCLTIREDRINTTSREFEGTTIDLDELKKPKIQKQPATSSDTDTLNKKPEIPMISVPKDGGCQYKSQ